MSTRREYLRRDLVKCEDMRLHAAETRDSHQWPVDKPLGCLFRSLKGSKPPAPAVRRVADGQAQGRAKRRPG